MAGRRREQGPISYAKLRRRALAAQHRDLVAQDQQLEVLGVQATATANECAQQGPERDIEEGEGHYRRCSQPTREGPDTSIGALQDHLSRRLRFEVRAAARSVGRRDGRKGRGAVQREIRSASRLPDNRHSVLLTTAA